MWQDRFEEIKKEKKTYQELVNVGATSEELNNFELVVQNKFDNALPNDYLELLKVVNGLEFNGFIIYGIDKNLIDGSVNQNINGFIEFNEIWYENEDQKQYIFFGESNISWYVYNKDHNKYEELDNPSGSLIAEYDNFFMMIDKLLKDSLL